ncbi:kin of IRRE-like protein 3 [Ornithodoros turicata]|uniref:kin of IRRE-like protein 3 n=1 Tax=Ornithodoros turicata TaxID=34597 RepID=UPI003139D359
MVSLMSSQVWTLLVTLVSVYCCCHFWAVQCLRLVRLEMPGVVIRGDPVWLNCSFDLESDELYSVKWYKNNQEFFRYIPSDRPPGQSYGLAGIYVDSSRTTVGNLLLKKTDLNTEGTYRCEVSADAPSFQTIRAEKELKVYVLPKEGPEIRGTKPHYRVGDVVNVTCHAAASKPAAMLMWFINGEEVPPENEKMYPVVRDSDRLYHSSLGMTFVVRPEHFLYGTMKLKCTATVSGAYFLSSEETVAAQDAKNTGSDDDKPAITGGQTTYHVGDLVNVTCTYSRYGRPVDLQWHLNDKEVSNKYLVHYPTYRLESGRLVTSLGLRFSVRPYHFVNDEMRIKCTATMTPGVRSPHAGDPYSEKEFALGSSRHSSGLHVSEHFGAVTDPNGCGRLTQGLISTCMLLIYSVYRALR